MYRCDQDLSSNQKQNEGSVFLPCVRGLQQHLLLNTVAGAVKHLKSIM